MILYLDTSSLIKEESSRGNDTLIAAIALAHDATLVSGNTDEFSRVSGLRLVNWG